MTHLETTMSDWLANGPRYVTEGITSVRIKNKAPTTNYKGEWYWCPDSIVLDTEVTFGGSYDIPPEICPKISFHASRDDAHAFLSESCIIWAKAQAKEQA